MSGRCAAAALALLVFAGTAAAQDTAAELETIRGLVQSSREATLSSQIAGRVVELPFREGARFERDELLVAFDCALYEAELAAARAERLARRRTWENNQELARLSAVGALEVEVSAAEFQKAAARVRAAEVQVSRCEVRAPFAGRVVSSHVNRYESVGVHQELLAIADDSSLEIELIVPSRWLTWLAPGAALEFAVDETGAVHEATVAAVAARADAVSQTVRLRAAFSGHADGVIPGMSGSARFAAPR